MKEASDEELIQKIALGNEDAFLELTERYQRMVYGTIVKMFGDPIEAEDIAQQVFLRVYKAAPRYRPEAAFKTWLFTILRNLVFNESKKKSRRHGFFSLFGSSSEGEEIEIRDMKVSDPFQKEVSGELSDEINQAIRALPEKQRYAFLLQYYDDMGYEEIASTMKLTLPSVKSLLFRARETLKKKLHGYL